jgi:hypothetical protein
VGFRVIDGGAEYLIGRSHISDLGFFLLVWLGLIQDNKSANAQYCCHAGQRKKPFIHVRSINPK